MRNDEDSPSVLSWLLIAVGFGMACWMMLSSDMEAHPMTFQDWMPLIGSLIAAVAAIIVALIPIWAKGKTIGKIDDRTTEMKVTVNDTNKKAEEVGKGIKKLVDDLNVRQALEQRVPAGKDAKDLILVGTEKMIEQYNKMHEQCQEAQREITRLTAENAWLQAEVQRLSDQLIAYTGQQQDPASNATQHPGMKPHL